MSLFDKCRKFVRADEMEASGLLPYFHPITATFHGTEVEIGGHRLIMAGSNNYLGLTHHPAVVEAALKATREYGTGCSGSRFLNGTLELHNELEAALADFFGFDSAVVFSTGFQTNLGVLSILGGREDLIFCDRENHASIYDGIRLSYAPIRKYRHNDMDDLERMLAEAPADRGKLIMSDGIFSMLGDLVNLPRMRELATRYDAVICIDDAHSVGVIGKDGRGTPSHFGIDVELMTGTFSKSFGSLGGFFVGPREVVEFVKFHARSMIFSAAIPPSNTAAALAALKVMRTEPEHLENLTKNIIYMRNGLREIGFDVQDDPSAIIPVMIGDDIETFAAWRKLYDEGVFTNAVISPAVPKGQSLLRTSYMATHTREQLDRCLEVFSRVGEELQLAK